MLIIKQDAPLITIIVKYVKKHWINSKTVKRSTMKFGTFMFYFKQNFEAILERNI